MDAIEFLKQRHRMCDMETCDSCPASFLDECDCDSKNIVELVEIVEKWSQSHPQKTMIQDFFEKFHNAPKREDGSPCACPAHLGYVKGNNANYWESECNEFDYNYVKCWSRPLED